MPTRDLRNRATDNALGAAAGTNRRIQFKWELSPPLLGGGFQLVIYIQDEEFRARPHRISCAILLTTAMATLWHRL
jgi:hypothetical protein